MKLVQSFLTKNPCYTAGRKSTVKGLMLHSVGCPQPKASVFIGDWNRAGYTNACVHAFIDGNDGTILQTLPWNHRGWHCGGTGNDTYIGIEMCEPECIRYTGGSSFTCSDTAAAKAVAKRTYEVAVELFAMLCKEYGLNPLTDIISHKEGHAKGIASNHGDPEHLWTGLKLDYTMDGFRADVQKKLGGTQAASFKNLSEAEVIERVGPLFTADQKSSGILACVSMAQFILESGYGKTELAQKANNCFGMKKNLSGNTWSGTAWDGKSIYAKKTQEYSGGKYVTITADFRKYPSVEKSIADHSAYLLGAMNGSKLRYAGLKGCTDYKKAAQIIKGGGYATSPTYVTKLCGIIQRWNLTRFNVVPTVDKLYRVRKSWDDSKSQKGAYSVLENAIRCVDASAPGDGYCVFDGNGICVYPLPYLVTTAESMTVRKSASDDAPKATTAEKGVYTIMEVSGHYGRLKSGAGWLDLTDLSVTPAQEPGEMVVRRAKIIADYMVRSGFHYGKQGSEGTPASLKQAVEKNWHNASCTRFASWVFQAAGFLKEGKCLSHTLGNKGYLVDCEIIRVNMKFTDLLAKKMLKAGDLMISSKDTCGNNYCSIFAGYNAGKKYWFEGGNVTPVIDKNTNAYLNLGPLYVPYDEGHKVEWIVRPKGKGSGGIDLTEYT